MLLSTDRSALRLPATAALLAVLLLGGCGGGEGYPSLARRPAELLGTEGQALPRCPHATEACPDAGRVSGTAAVVMPAPQPPEPAPAPADSAGLAGRLAALLAEAKAAHGGFMAKRAAAEAVADTRAEPGSDGWARATTALSELESAHGGVLAALAGIDRIEVDDRLAHPADDPAVAPRADREAIRGVSAQVAALVAEEAGAIDAIRARLRQ